MDWLQEVEYWVVLPQYVEGSTLYGAIKCQKEQRSVGFTGYNHDFSLGKITPTVLVWPRLMWQCTAADTILKLLMVNELDHLKKK